VLSSIHDVRRATRGEILFPLGIGVAALMARSDAIFAHAVVTLAFSDVTARLVGERASTPARRIPGGSKTDRGSAAFFATTVAIGAPFLVVSGQGWAAAWLVALAVAAAPMLALRAAGVVRWRAAPATTRGSG
jgi:dolichol kinase